MDKVQELVKLIRETKTQKDTENISDADKLINKIHARNKTDRECFEIKKEVQEFLASDAAYEDKMRVAYEAECIWMLCSALEGVGRKVDV